MPTRRFHPSAMTARALLAVVCLCTFSLLSACGRTTLSVTLGGDPSILEESPVLGADADTSNKIALIDLRGLIVDGPRTSIPFVQSGDNPVDELVARLDKARRDNRVKAVVLRINSPGGAVTASDTLYREILRFRESSGKPVVVSMSEVAASGGYYIALAGDRILAQPTTITGSIGVIIPTMNFSAGLARIGIVSRSVKSGTNKDLANPLEPMRDGQYAILQGLVDEMYTKFRGLVISRRQPAGLDPARADELMDGRVFTGDHALAVHLVDQLGDLHDAFDLAKSLANLSSAKLIKYHAEGDRPKTAYALSDLPVPTAGHAAPASGTSINMLQLNVGADLSSLSPGVAYFLWSPTAQ